MTHDQIEAMSMSDRVVVIHKGSLQQIGKPSEIYSYPANTLVSSIVGTPAMNILPVVVEDNCYLFHSRDLSAEIPPSYKDSLVEGKYQLGIRPEDVKLVLETTPNALPAEVFLIEAFGYEKLLEIDLANLRVRARVSPRIQVKVGDKIFIHFDERKTRFFDVSGTLIPNKPF